MTVNEAIASSTLAFSSGEYEKALEYAKEAIKEDPKNASAYKCAADAYISLNNMGKAIESLTAATKFDPSNGNRFYDLGFAYMLAQNSSEAVKNLTRAEALGCSNENLLRLYNILGMVCFDISRYDDALINFNKAERIYGLDLDILQRKAVIYGMKDDYRNGIMTANQIKLVAPSEYIGYRLAFNFLIQKKDWEKAKKELQKAKKYAKIGMDYYTDCLQLEIRMYSEDKDEGHYYKALKLIEQGLSEVKPSATDVTEAYINAAEIYQMLKKPEEIIACLDAAQNPCDSFNNGFKVLFEKQEEIELTDYAIEDMIYEDRMKLQEQYGEYGLMDLAESIEPDELGNRDYFTEIDEDTGKKEEPYVLNKEMFEPLPEKLMNQINKLYVGAYKLQNNFDRVLYYAKRLQTSSDEQLIYIGMYTEANAMKHLKMPEADAKYDEIIKFFKTAMIKNPSNMMAVMLRAQSCLDIGQIEEAEKLCSILPKEARESLKEIINKAKNGDE